MEKVILFLTALGYSATRYEKNGVDICRGSFSYPLRLGEYKLTKYYKCYVSTDDEVSIRLWYKYGRKTTEINTKIKAGEDLMLHILPSIINSLDERFFNTTVQKFDK